MGVLGKKAIFCIVMGHITSLFAYKVARQVSPGVSIRDLLSAIGLDPEGSVDPKIMLASEDYYGFFAALAKRDPAGASLPLRAGASMQCDDFGAFGLAWKSATDLRGSYIRAERFGRRLTNVSTYELEPVSDGAFVHLHRTGERHLGLRLSNEATIASITTISRQVSTSPFSPLAVYFKHNMPGAIDDHEAFFECPVHFGSDRDALLVSGESLATRNRLGDESSSAFFDQYLQNEVITYSDQPGLGQRVRRAVAQALSDGVPPLSDIAASLGMSARTMQRRLSADGLTYQDMVDAARRELARKLLRDTQYSLAEVAFLTGFSEQSTFTRAFKRWSGQTPRSFRLKADTSI